MRSGLVQRKPSLVREEKAEPQQPQERMKRWEIWILSEEDIDMITDESMNVPRLSADQKELVADRFKKMVESSLSGPYDWYAMLQDAIREVRGG